MSGLEQEPNLSQENYYSFRSYSELEATPEVEKLLNSLEAEFEKGSDIHEFYSCLTSRFGQLINRSEIKLKSCNGNPLDKEQWGKYPQRVNDGIYKGGLNVYKILHYNQLILSKTFKAKEWVLLPDRRELLSNALDGMKYDKEIEDMCRDMMSVRVRGEQFASILSPSEQEMFLEMLSGSILTSKYRIGSLIKKIQNYRYSKNFKILKLPNNLRNDELEVYYFKKIVSNRGIDLGE